MKSLVDILEIAAVIGRSVPAVRWHIKQGRIKPIRLGRRLLFDPDDVIASLKGDSSNTFHGIPARGGVADPSSIFDNQMFERAVGISKKEK